MWEDEVVVKWKVVRGVGVEHIVLVLKGGRCLISVVQGFPTTHYLPKKCVNIR